LGSGGRGLSDEGSFQSPFQSLDGGLNLFYSQNNLTFFLILIAGFDGVGNLLEFGLRSCNVALKNVPEGLGVNGWC